MWYHECSIDISLSKQKQMQIKQKTKQKHQPKNKKMSLWRVTAFVLLRTRMGSPGLPLQSSVLYEDTEISEATVMVWTQEDEITCQHHRVSFTTQTSDFCEVLSRSEWTVWVFMETCKREAFERVDVHPRMPVCWDGGFEAVTCRSY